VVRFHAAEWKLDPHRIGIVGFSAGGHLAATAGTHFDAAKPHAADPVERPSRRPDFIVLVYPVFTMGERRHGGSRKNLLGRTPSPEPTDKTPPAILTRAVTPPEERDAQRCQPRGGGACATVLPRKFDTGVAALRMQPRNLAFRGTR
jgi:hypothetical protein